MTVGMRGERAEDAFAFDPCFEGGVPLGIKRFCMSHPACHIQQNHRVCCRGQPATRSTAA